MPLVCLVMLSNCFWNSFVIFSTSFECLSVNFPFFLSILASDSADDTMLQTLMISELADVNNEERKSQVKSFFRGLVREDVEMDCSRE